MRIAAIPLSVIAKNGGRLDPRYYLGDPETPKRIADAEKRAKDAAALLARLRADVRAEARRVTKIKKEFGL